MMVTGKRQITVSILAILILSSISLADIRLPSIIGDNMVLQQGMQAPIWGWAEPNQKVTISLSTGGKWETTADKDGKWMVKIDTGKAGGPYEMTISDGNEITVKNILVGEVWICSGQSNMEFPLSQSTNGTEEVNGADYPQIRLFTVGKKVSYKPMTNCQGKWLLCTPVTSKGFSAVGYFFGKDLYKKLNVPIGLINDSWGGTPADSWMSKEYLENNPDFKPILKRFDDTVANYDELKKKNSDLQNEYQKKAAQAKSEGKPAPPKPNFQEIIGLNHPYSPTGLYYGMIVPVAPYSIRGAIWYQGESNAWRAFQYRTLFPAMIKNWRETWGEGDFPFLFVQLANFMAPKPEPAPSEWAELREAQLLTLSTPNTGMAVIIDVGDGNNIHPKNKLDVGNRLALWALAKTYGKDIVYSGPIYKSMEVQGNKVILSFDDVGGGLEAKGGAELRGFSIAGQDKKFVWADAKIEGNTVVVGSDKVAEPVAVRYAWADNPVCNLYNKEGLPATPFRTDTWPGVTFDKR